MKTITQKINVYKFDELPADTQQKIVDEWRWNDEFYSGSEVVDAMKAFAEQFGITLKTYELGGPGEHIRFCVPSFSEDYESGEDCTVRGARLWKYLQANNFLRVVDRYPGKNGPRLVDIRAADCPLTGVCYDTDILAPLLDFMAAPSDINWHELVGECMGAVIDCYNKEYEYWQSDESIRDDITAGDYDFLLNGSIY